jgi:hypothetical protein
MQELRANGLMVLSGGSLTIQDWTGLKEAASIRPTSTYAATWSETQPHELGAASDARGPSVNRRREQIEQLAEAAVARPFRKQSFSGIGTASGKFAVQFYRGRAGITGAPPRGL